MAKANDKKVVKETRNLLLSAMGNLLESHRERKFTYAQRSTPLPRRVFCRRFRLIEATVSHIETGRFLNLDFNQLRMYLAATHGRTDVNFLNSFRKVYEGIKEIDDLLRML